MNMMRAAIYYGKEDIRIENIPEPTASEDLAVVEIEWGGICGSDLHEYIRGPSGIPREGSPHPFTGETLPLTWGHEFCGRIKSAPAGASLKVGQAVMVDPRLCCRSCKACKNGLDHACQKFGFLGVSGMGGGFAECVAVEPRMIYPLPENVALKYAPIIEPLAVAQHAVSAAACPSLTDAVVLVVGSGPVGIALAITLRAHGVRKVIVSEPTIARRGQVMELVDLVINPLEEDVAEQCRAVTNGEGVDIAFDCAGISRALPQVFKSIRIHGTYVNVAIWGTSIEIPFREFMFRRIRVVPSMAYNDGDFKEVMELLSQGKFQGYEQMVTARILLEDIVDKGLKELVNNKDQHVKILVTPKAKNLQ